MITCQNNKKSKPEKFNLTPLNIFQECLKLQWKIVINKLNPIGQNLLDESLQNENFFCYCMKGSLQENENFSKIKVFFS